MAFEWEVALNIAKRLQEAITKEGLGFPTQNKVDYLTLYDNQVQSAQIRKSTRKLFFDGHYARAVEEAYKCLNNFVKAKSGLITVDGQDLMNQALSLKNPALKLNSLKTVTQRDEQLGYMQILGGCMTGIRNPRAHDETKVDSPQDALALIVWADYLVNVVGKAKRTSKNKGVTTT